MIPVDPGGGDVFAASIAALPAGHPAKIAEGVLSHPVVRQAAALHNHLRGHDVAGSAPGVTVTRSQGAGGGPESTVTMDLGLGSVRHFHERLLSSLGTRGWDGLHGHYQDLLAAHLKAAALDPKAMGRLQADCRRAAFVRGYLAAYLREKALDDELKAEEKRLEAEIEATEKKLQEAVAAGDRKAEAAIEKERKKLEAEIAAARREYRKKQLDAGDRKAASQIDREAEQVKLRLKLSG